MEEPIVNLFLSLIKNNGVTILFESIYLIFFLKSLYYSYIRKNGCLGALKRGDKSTKLFPIMFGILTLFITEIIGNSTIFGDYKNFVTIINLIVIFYLCFYSDWFRNITVGFLDKILNKTEKHA